LELGLLELEPLELASNHDIVDRHPHCLRHPAARDRLALLEQTVAVLVYSPILVLDMQLGYVEVVVERRLWLK
jgi:hypothetical protein